MTAQALLFKIQLLIDPATKNGQKFNDATAVLTVAGASNATPIVITTSANHGLVTGNQVYVTGVGGNTNANNTGANPNWTITKITDTTFSLDNSSGNSAWTSGGSVYPSLVGSVDGAAFARQRILDIYNQARMALFTAIDNSMDVSEKITAISGTVIKKTDFTFASGVATKPTGYIQTVKLTDVNGAEITVLPLSLYRQLKDRISTTNRMVFDYGTTFESPDVATPIPPDAATYVLRYYGITDFTLSDILGNSTVETFNINYYPIIIELAQAIASEQGTIAVNALAQKLIGAK